MSADFTNVTNNIIAEGARRGMSRNDIHTALGWSYGPWNLRQKRPGEWKIGELVRVAAILQVPLYAILGTLINSFPVDDDGVITLSKFPPHAEENHSADE